jgi:hypothetical protein
VLNAPQKDKKNTEKKRNEVKREAESREFPTVPTIRAPKAESSALSYDVSPKITYVTNVYTKPVLISVSSRLIDKDLRS